jgi:hypothetical protein
MAASGGGVEVGGFIEYRAPHSRKGTNSTSPSPNAKIVLGSCHRPYGADCVHEHACIRCNFLQVQPGQAGRLADIKANLQAQVEEAQHDKCPGDVDQLRLTIQWTELRRLAP